MDVPKYAHVATMEELEENGWNMNIPRYVDTSEEEEEIDLLQASKELKDIENEIAVTKDILAEQFKALGLEGLL